MSIHSSGFQAFASIFRRTVVWVIQVRIQHAELLGHLDGRLPEAFWTNVRHVPMRKLTKRTFSKSVEHLVLNIPTNESLPILAFIKAKPNMPFITLPHWLMMMDDHTQLKRVEFFNSTSGIVEYLRELFSMDRNRGIPVKFVLCDNKQEIQDRAKSTDWKLNIVFEFTPRSTPRFQRQVFNSHEKGTSNYGYANLPLDFCYRLYPEDIWTAAKLDSLSVINIQRIEKTRYQFFNNDAEPGRASFAPGGKLVL
jgi:hypothetical protein